jgi:8-oxo-dGTP pyrophosphatase MutT (NUDIX family)
VATPNIAPARPASTVIVLRPSTRERPDDPDALSLRTGDPFEILMVKRNDKVAFMAGSYVFPGGRVDEGDQPPAGERVPKAGFPDLSDDEEALYRVCALGDTGDRDPAIRHTVLPRAHAAGTDHQAR